MADPPPTLRFTAKIERHHPDLPVYLLVPEQVVAGFAKTATFVVETRIGGTAIGRRSVKPWGDGRWFLELTKPQCRRLDIGEGDAVEVALAPAPETPPELLDRLSAEGLQDPWQRLTSAQRRSLAEDIFAARTEKTRAARVEKTLAWLRDRI